MKALVFAITLALTVQSSSLFAQKKLKYEVVKDGYLGISYSIPKDWRYDEYSSSSVCDCPGVIIDNFDNDVRINVYTSDAEGMQEQKRLEVWDYVWDESNAMPYSYNGSGEIKFTALQGKWGNEDEELSVIRLDAHNGELFARIFIFGPEDQLNKQMKHVHHFIDTFKIQKKKAVSN